MQQEPRQLTVQVAFDPDSESIACYSGPADCGCVMCLKSVEILCGCPTPSCPEALFNYDTSHVMTVTFYVEEDEDGNLVVRDARSK